MPTTPYARIALGKKQDQQQTAAEDKGNSVGLELKKLLTSLPKISNNNNIIHLPKSTVTVNGRGEQRRGSDAENMKQ